jgi:hypothetical protein
MRYIQLLPLFLLLAASAGCDKHNPADSSQDDGSLAILSLGKDSVYWGETTWLVLNSPRNSTHGLQLFVGSHKMSIDSCIEGRLYFRSQLSAESGTFRMYDDGSPVKTDQWINFLPHSVSFNTDQIIPSVSSAYVNETFFLQHTDLPLRRSEWDVYIGEVRIDAELDDDSNAVYARPGAKSVGSELRVRIFDKFYRIGPFEVLRHTAPFLAGNTTSRIIVNLEEMEGIVLFSTQADTILKEGFGKGIDVNFYPGESLIQDGDTIRLSINGSRPNCTYQIELALTEDVTGSVSGRLDLHSNNNHGHDEAMAISFRNTAWIESDGNYTLSAFGTLVKDQIVSVSYSDTSPDQKQELLQFLGATRTSYFSITLFK